MNHLKKGKVNYVRNGKDDGHVQEIGLYDF